MNRRPINPYKTIHPSNSSGGGDGRLQKPVTQNQTNGSLLPRKTVQTTRSCPNTSMMISRGPPIPVESYLSQINEIEKGLYLCGARALTPSVIHDLGICCIFNVTVELPNVPYTSSKQSDAQIESVKIPIDDSPYANLAYYFERTIDKIDDLLRSGKRVLVHCVAGVSRSTTIIIAYLMKHRKMTLRQAFEHVKSRRPIIRPNPGFFRQLIEFESRLFGKTTVKMMWNAAAGGNIPDIYEIEYINTMNFINKYGCYHHNPNRGDDGVSRTWPGGPILGGFNRCPPRQ